MNKILKAAVVSTVLAVSMGGAGSASAACGSKDLPKYEDFMAAANTAATETDQFGFGLPMWATLVDETGKICYVYSTDSGTANTGASAGNKAWLGSRVISAQKANTANAFSLDVLPISTGGVYALVQPGGSLYGLQHSNPVDASVAYAGNVKNFGTKKDPLVGKNIGGVNVFGGGVALYKTGSVKVGAVGASGDTSCRDHAFAYRLRIALGLNNLPDGTDDGLTLVATPSALFQQPLCGVNDPSTSTMDSSASDFGVRAAP